MLKKALAVATLLLSIYLGTSLRIHTPGSAVQEMQGMSGMPAMTSMTFCEHMSETSNCGMNTPEHTAATQGLFGQGQTLQLGLLLALVAIALPVLVWSAATSDQNLRARTALKRLRTRYRLRAPLTTLLARSGLVAETDAILA